MLLAGYKKLWNWLRDNEKQLKISFTVVAALYAAIEYRNKIHQDRIAASLTYIQRHGDGQILGMRKNLNSFWFSPPMESLLKDLKAETSGVERVKLYNSEVPKLLSRGGYLSDIHGILSFYREIALCVKGSSCDNETICSYLFTDIQSFRQNYRVVFGDWQTGLGETAPADVKDLAERMCSKQFRAYCKDVPSSPGCSGR